MPVWRAIFWFCLSYIPKALIQQTKELTTLQEKAVSLTIDYRERYGMCGGIIFLQAFFAADCQMFVLFENPPFGFLLFLCRLT